MGKTWVQSVTKTNIKSVTKNKHTECYKNNIQSVAKTNIQSVTKINIQSVRKINIQSVTKTKTKYFGEKQNFSRKQRILEKNKISPHFSQCSLQSKLCGTVDWHNEHAVIG